MKLLVNHDDRLVVALPDNTNMVYVMAGEFVHGINLLDGRCITVSSLQFQTILVQAKIAAKERKEKGNG